MLREVISGERLTGHRSGSGRHPEISIYDGIGAGKGSCICVIQGFHWATVFEKGATTELLFENKTSLEREESCDLDKVFGGADYEFKYSGE